jgi:hypothetical protein
MLELITEASALGALLEETRGVVGVVLATSDGELRATVGSVRDGNGGALVAAALTGELNRIGTLLGLGVLGVASLKSATAARVFAEQSGTVVGIELDPKRPLGELETKLRMAPWAPNGERLEAPTPGRVPVDPTGEDLRSTGNAGGLPTGLARLSPIAPEPRAPVAPTRPPAPMPPGPRSSQPIPTAPMSASRPSSLTPAPPPAAQRPTSPTPGPLPATARSNPSGGFPTRAASTSQPMRSVGSGPVFTGDLEEFRLPDLLEFLRNSHRTGLLVCTTDRGVGTVQLSRGLIIAADSPNALDLRVHFLTSGELPPERRRLLAALPLECFGDDMIDGVLVSRDLVPRDQVEQARIARIYSAFREMMGWKTGRFSFDPAVPIVANPALALSAQSILMQIYQEQDEHDR